MDDRIIIKLLKEESYDENNIAETICDIHGMSGMVKDIFEEYLSTGTISDITIHGYSIQSLKKELGMKTIGAFLTLDWLVKDPDSALLALESGIL